METITQHWEDGDLGWQKVLRTMQSTWREAQGLSPGRGGGDKRPIGSMLTSEHAASGRNFLTDVARRRVDKELEHAASDEGRGRVIEEQRLRGNLLASQPLAFNLFAGLAAHPNLTRRALTILFPDLAHRVEDVKFEWSPGRGDDEFLGNHSAFDVAIDLAPAESKGHTLGIEVKYAEKMRDGNAQVRQRARDVAASAGFRPITDDSPLLGPELVQVFLDHLLACSMTQHADQPDATFVFLYPAINHRAQQAVTRYRSHLPPGSAAAASFRVVTLEEVVGVLAACTDAPWVAAFHDRYLAYQRVSHLVTIPRAGSQPR